MNIDLIIIGVFLLITLGIGLYYGKDINTFQAYAVGNRKMSDFVITISLIATTYGGGILISRLDAYYRQGFYTLIMDLASSMNLWLAARFVIPRMKEFMGHFSIAESMGSMYGPIVRIITAILGIIMSIALLAAQFKVGLTIATTLYPEQLPNYLTAILALLVIGYSTFGGVRAVALTDVYQFCLFGICLPILISMFLYNTQNPLVRQLIAIPQFNLEKVLAWNDALATTLPYFIWHAVFPFDPARIQRFYMASSIQQAIKVLNNSAIIRVILSILFLSVAVALYLGGHEIKRSQNVLNYILNLAYFPGIRGILVTAIIALLMSTADSNLHAASVLFANDIWPVVYKKANQCTLKTVRTASALIGTISLFVVLHTSSVAQLLNKTVHFYGPAVTVPLILSSFGFRPRAAAVLLTMGISMAASAYRTYYTIQKITQRDIFQLLVLSALTLVAAHYLLPKRPNTGWVGIKDRSPLDLQNQETKRWWFRLLAQFKTLWTTKYWQSLFPKQEVTFISLGIYLISSTLVALCVIKKEYFFPYIYWYIAIMAIGTILAIYPALHSYKQGGNAILHGIWPGLLFVLLFISTIEFAKLGHFRPIVCALVIASIGLSTVLLSLKVAMMMLGIAITVHAYTPPRIPFWRLFFDGYQEVSMELIFAVAIGVATLAGFSIYHYLCNKDHIKLKIIELARTYERRAALESIYSQVNWSRLDPTYGSEMLQTMSETLKAPCEYLYNEGQQKLGEDVNRFIKKLSAFSSLLLQSAKEARRLGLNKDAIQSVAIQPIILKVHSTIRALGEPMQLLLRNQTEVKQLVTDLDLFERFLTINLLATSKSEQDHIVTLTITDTMLRYGHTHPTQMNQPTTLPALAFFISTDTSLQTALPLYDIKDDTTLVYLPKTEDQLYQAESRQIIQAHGGYVEVIENKKALTCLYILPVSGEQVMHFKSYDPADLAK